MLILTTRQLEVVGTLTPDLLVLYQQGLFPLFRCGLTDYRRDILFICEERGIPEKMLNSMRSGCGISCFPGSRSYGTD